MAARGRPGKKGMEVSPLTDQSGVDLDAIFSALAVLEGRVLHLIRECSEGTIPLADVLSEMHLLGRDVGRLDRRAEEANQRRDLPFSASARLEDIGHHCTWLYRKIQMEQVFFRKLHMEVGLRQLISEEAFSVYQALLELEEREAFLQRSTEEQIRSTMRLDAAEDQETHLHSVLSASSEN